jgi:rhamnogalacturonan endolyase
VFKANGDGPSPSGIQLRDAATGEQIFGVPSKLAGGIGRALALDVDPRHFGLEMWGYDTPGRSRRGFSWQRRRRGDRDRVAEDRDGGRRFSDPAERTEQNRDTRQGLNAPSDRPRPGATGLYNARGEQITKAMPGPCNMGVWWDGDLLRELLDGVRVTKWVCENERETELLDGDAYDCVSNNGSKSNPCLCADILGDWREEIIARTRDSRELRIFVTSVPTDHRLTTLMHDPIYRLAVAWQNVAYNQPAHPGFYLGHDMPDPPRPASTTASRD